MRDSWLVIKFLLTQTQILRNVDNWSQFPAAGLPEKVKHGEQQLIFIAESVVW